HAIFGVNHSGDIVSRNAATGDGVWFGVVTDGSNNRSYASYVGADLKNSLPASDFATLIPSPPYISGLSFSGPGSPSSNGNQPDPVWADVEIRHVDGLVTMKVNQVPILTVTDRGEFTEGVFMLGMNDQFSSIGSPDTFVIYDNVRVVPLESEGGVTVVSVNATDSVMTEGVSGDTATIVVSREGSTDEPLTVLLELSGDAQLGADYSGAVSQIVFPAGNAEATVLLTSINDDEVEAPETIRIDVAKSDDYFIGAAASAVVVLNDNDKEDTGPAPEPEVTLFGDDFDSDSSDNWAVHKSTDDTAVTFGYDYSADGIPAAPNSDGTTLGIKFEANIADPTGAEAVSISPSGGNFTGDYEVKFDMWINANGPFPGGGGGSTEFFTAGVGTTGDHLQWAADTADGAWFGVTGEGGSGNSGDFRAHIGGARQDAESGAYAAGTSADSRNNTNGHYADAFPGQSPPAAQAAAFPDKQTGALQTGAVGFAWRQVNITKIGDSVTWAIDGVTIATLNQSLGAFTTEGNIFVGYYDAFSSVSDNRATSFGLVDNLVVHDLGVSDEPSDIIQINTVSKYAAPFSLTFETKSNSTYKIEASHDLKKWGEIGEVQGTGSLVEFTDWREALFKKQYYRLKLME
ncbi:MAG TPA: Calx-beta domain-containing protein, partial [Verrucomicrobiota bacterium]|nr:Calx-beta domain-containing protein [Verrucomicrobiota bacterium]